MGRKKKVKVEEVQAENLEDVQVVAKQIDKRLLRAEQFNSRIDREKFNNLRFPQISILMQEIFARLDKLESKK